ncbi:MAG: glutaredoxin 3 [Immundisolibacterales bacterium]|nr:glutaredoxin 3 [Immundisolibacterales bacterium]
MNAVVMYSSGFCPYCSAAKRLLSARGVPFEEIDVDFDPERRAEMVARANGGHTVPQIFIGEHHVGGCDELYALERAGELDALLAEAAP